VRIKVKVRIYTHEETIDTEGILSNEERGREGGVVLLIKGKEWADRYDVLRIGGGQ